MANKKNEESKRRKKNKKARKKLEEMMNKNKLDIISNLSERPFLSNLTKKIFSFLDMKSLDNCRKVSEKWETAINDFSISISREIDWIDDSFMPMCQPLSNHRGGFGNGYLKRGIPFSSIFCFIDFFSLSSAMKFA
jgi:hypothetical protein